MIAASSITPPMTGTMISVSNDAAALLLVLTAAFDACEDVIDAAVSPKIVVAECDDAMTTALPTLSAAVVPVFVVPPNACDDNDDGVVDASLPLDCNAVTGPCIVDGVKKETPTPPPVIDLTLDVVIADVATILLVAGVASDARVVADVGVSAGATGVVADDVCSAVGPATTVVGIPSIETGAGAVVVIVQIAASASQMHVPVGGQLRLALISKQLPVKTKMRRDRIRCTTHTWLSIALNGTIHIQRRGNVRHYAVQIIAKVAQLSLSHAFNAWKVALTLETEV
jgi:hypothetical protein